MQVLIPVRASDAQGNKAYNQCFLFDMVNESPGATSFLKQLLEDPKIIKILHDCRQDAAALLVQKGISLRNVYDTQARLSALWQGMINVDNTGQLATDVCMHVHRCHASCPMVTW